MIRRSALQLAAGAFALALTGCATNHLNDLSNSLKSALAGTPVDVTQQQGYPPHVQRRLYVPIWRLADSV